MILDVQVVEIAPLIPGMPYYKCRVRAHLDVAAATVIMSVNLVNIKKNDGTIVHTGETMTQEGGSDWWTSPANLTCSPVYPGDRLTASVYVKWYVVDDETVDGYGTAP